MDKFTAKESDISRGKHCGILLPNPRDIRRYFDMGFRFIAAGSDAGLLHNAAVSLVQSLQKELAEPKPR